MSKLASAVIALAIFSFPLHVETADRPWKDGQCLASALHYEARGEPIRGRRAVLDTILHRMLATGKDACGVVMQKGQFSWTKNRPLLPYDDSQREKLAKVVAHPRVLKNEKFKYFYSGASPYWAGAMICVKIHGHNFCKEKV